MTWETYWKRELLFETPSSQNEEKQLYRQLLHRITSIANSDFSKTKLEAEKILINNQVSSILLSIHTICKIVPQNKINSSYKMNLYYTKDSSKNVTQNKKFHNFL